jgi:tetratricopeptide (TPR) repeat protein
MLAAWHRRMTSPMSKDHALARLLNYYQYTAESADAQLAPDTKPAPTSPVSAPIAAPELVGRDQARAWMTAEYPNLIGCIDFAAEHDQHARVVGLTAAIAAYLQGDGLWMQATKLHTAAAKAARNVGNQVAEANALKDLGAVLARLGDYPGATAALEQALDISRDQGDRLVQAQALTRLGAVRYVADDNSGATRVLEEALEIYRESGDRHGEAYAMIQLGGVRFATSNYPEAIDLLRQALEISRDLGDRLD